MCLRGKQSKKDDMKKLLKILLGLVAVIIVLVIALAITLLILSPGKTPPIKDANGNVLPNSIATAEYVEIGGIPQWMLIRGHDVSKPIILVLHGGAGTPQTHLFPYYNGILEKYFVVVNWEQRGTGKSYSDDIPPGRWAPAVTRKPHGGHLQGELHEFA